jgi:molecular chaperone DnaK (HSP70)
MKLSLSVVLLISLVLIVELVSDFFNRKEPNKNINPDEASYMVLFRLASALGISQRGHRIYCSLALHRDH